MERSFEEVQAIREDVASRYNVKFPDPVLEPLWFGRRPTNMIQGRYAIVDQNSGTAYNVCTDLYKPIYHELVIKDVEDAAAAHPEYGKPEIKVSLLADGAKLRVHVVFEEVDYTIKSGDVVHPTTDIKSSYDLGWKYSMDFGAYRLICSNGMKIGEVLESYKKRHLTSLNPDMLSDSLASGMFNFSNQAQLWQKWAGESISMKQYEELWTELPFSKPEKEKIEAHKSEGDGILLLEALKQNELTKWGFFNALTAYTTHNIASELRQIDIGPKIARVFEH